MVPSEASATLDEAQKALEGAVAGVLAETAWLVELLSQDAAAPAAHAVSHDFHRGQRFFFVVIRLDGLSLVYQIAANAQCPFRPNLGVALRAWEAGQGRNIGC